MKKLVNLLFILLLFSCGSKETAPEPTILEKKEVIIPTKVQNNNTGTDILNYNEISEVPVVEFDKEIFNKQNIEKKTAGGGYYQDEIDFSFSTVNYFDKRQFEAKKIEATESDIANFTPDNSPLNIVDFGPVGELPEEMSKPSIYIMFSKPMVPLRKLGEPIENLDYITIDPPLKGVYRWYGSKLLSFDVTEPILSDSEGFSREYVVKLNKGIKALTGGELEDYLTFSFYTSEVKIVNMFIPNKSGENIQRVSNVPFDLAHSAVVRFNMPVDISYIKKGMMVDVNGTNVPFSLARTNDKNSNRDKRTVVVNIDKSVEFDNNDQIKIFLLEGAVPRAGTPAKTNNEYKRYSTLNPFRFTNTSSYSYATPNLPEGNRYPTYINFNQYVDSNQDFSKLISTSLDVDLKDKITVYGETVLINNLPVESGDHFKINISKDLKDIYGQNLSSGDIEANITIPEARPYIIFPDKSYGASKVSYPRYGYLESQFNPGLIVKHQNLDSLNFGIEKLESIIKSPPLFEVESISLESAIKNNPNYNYIDLKSSMNEFGNGSVYFKATGSYNSNGDLRSNSDNLLVQVTDIGLTVRYAYNKIIIWANSLSDGTPFPNAQVKLISVSKNELKSGVTDKNGLCVFELPEGFYRNNLDGDYRKSFWVQVDTKEDRAELQVFSNQSPYRFGVPSGRVDKAENILDRTVLFSDRQLYKPGEEVSFRGIHWLQKLGEFTPYSGKFELTLTSSGRKSKELYKAKGTTTKSGGFYGTFKLPEDIEPGTYYLRYKARGNKFSTPIKIAFFRRLNFAVSGKVPNREFYSGDSISVPIEAYYLAGGAMPGADYDYFWTRKSISFRPPGERWKPFIFGIRSYTPEMDLDSGIGKLSAMGEAQIKQNATDHELKGGTYRYVMEATVTDIDNQQVSSTVSTLVHPSAFYIGAKLGSSSQRYWSRFIKAKKETSVQLSLVKPNGEIYQKNTDIKAELYKISWKASHQQGVYDRVNVSYNKTEELVKTLTAKIDKKGLGKINILPEESGSYILRITAFDKDGRLTETDLNFYCYGGGWYYWGNNSEKLSLVPDKDLYFVGDTAKIMVQSPLKEGKYLLTVEREGIVKEEVLYLDKNTMTIDIPIEEGYVPRMYVALTTYTSREEAPESYFEADLGKPKNIFGLTALDVSTKTRVLNVEVASSKDSYRPGDDTEVYIKVTKDGKPVKNAEIIYLAVDRGVVDLVNYHVPNPLEYFYDPRHFGVYTSGDDLRSYLMDPISYDISNLQGGDGLKLEERKDFNPLAAFEPYLLTDENGIAQVSYTLPDTLTTYRTTVIAIYNNKVGYSEDEILVKNPINVRSAFPRRLRNRDTGVGDVVLQNNTDKEQIVTVSLSSEGIKIDGDNKKSITIPPQSIYKVPFLMIAKDYGEFDVDIIVESEVLNEKVTQKIIIERPLAKEAFAIAGTVNREADEKNTLFAEEGLIIPEMIAENYGEYNFNIYASRMGILTAPINNLVDDYTCNSLLDYIYTYISDAILGEKITALDYIYHKNSVEKVIKELELIQTENGWLKFYSNQDYPNIYLDTLSLYFIVSARETGIDIPKNLEEDLAASLLSNYKNKRRLGSSAAFGAYVLNRSGVDVKSLVDRLLKLNDELGISGYSYLVVTLMDQDRTDEAKEVWGKVKKYIRMGTRSVDINETYEMRWYFDSEIRSIATMAWAGLRVGVDNDILSKYINTLENRYNSYKFISHCDSLWTMVALKAFVDHDKIDSLNMVTNIKLNDKEIANKTITDIKDSELSVTLPIFESPIVDLPRNKIIPVRVEKNGEGNLYYSAEIKYALVDEMVEVRDEGVGLYLAYETLDGDVVEPDTLEIGETYRVRVIISSDRRRSFVNLEVPIPSGMEIVDPGFATTGSYRNQGGTGEEKWTRETSYGDEYEFTSEGYISYDRYFGSWWWLWKNEPDQKIYDNRVTYHWEDFYEGKRELTFLARTTNKGIYPTPPAQATLQFEPEVFGRTGGLLVVIK